MFPGMEIFQHGKIMFGEFGWLGSRLASDGDDTLASQLTGRAWIVTQELDHGLLTRPDGARSWNSSRSDLVKFPYRMQAPRRRSCWSDCGGHLT